MFLNSNCEHTHTHTCMGSFLFALIVQTISFEVSSAVCTLLALLALSALLAMAHSLRKGFDSPINPAGARQGGHLASSLLQGKQGGG